MENNNQLIRKYQKQQRALKKDIKVLKKKFPFYVAGFVFFSVGFLFLIFSKTDVLTGNYTNIMLYLFSILGLVFFVFMVLIYTRVKEKRKKNKALGNKLYMLMKL